MPSDGAAGRKRPVSALVLVYTRDLRVLLIERADFPDHWQSVTGSQEAGETLAETATRELREETGIDAGAYGGVVDWHVSNRYAIFPQWRDRYPPGTTHNSEHVFGLLVPRPVPVRLDPREHLRHAWLPWQQAAVKCFSWSNRDAINLLPERKQGKNG
uniref:Dihydroneopterin triphosphate pyrophosphatase n=1 Tax=bacterium enrichment culture TaxID=207831 RepID=A0A0R7N6M8_9BACT|nr:dihydroneopterin triphosphate pyrophosphatase [bacterium enrichment culture]